MPELQRNTPQTFFLLLLVLGCSAESSSPPAATSRRIERTTSGDTTIVRNFGAELSGLNVELHQEVSIGKTDGTPQEMLTLVNDVFPTEDGGVLLFEAAAREIRQYDGSGMFVRTVGRAGPGPGEFRSPTGIAIAESGEILIWDGQGKKVNVYSADGKFSGSWPVPSGVSGAFARGGHIDPQGFPLTRINIPHPQFPDSVHPEMGELTTQAGVRTDHQGKIVDSIVHPMGLRTPRTQNVTIREEGHGTYATEWSIPLEPSPTAILSRLGYYISGDPAAYALLVHRRSGGPLRMEMDRKQLHASEEERRDLFDLMVFNLKQMNASPAISVSDIPKVKPYFFRITPDYDGRLWVGVSQQGTRVPVQAPMPTMASDGRPNVGTPPTHEWIAKSVFDVFAPTGELLGTVTLPDKARFAAARGEKLWVQLRDEMDVPRLVRYRMVFPK